MPSGRRSSIFAAPASSTTTRYAAFSAISTSRTLASTCEELARDAKRGYRQRAQVEPHRAVGDPFEVMGELLRHRRLVTAANLRKAGQAGADDEALPVGGELGRKLLEEARPDRPRPDETHVAAKDVPQLRELVELRGAEPP